MASKTCNRCGVTKPTTEFHIARRNKDGRVGDCKVCKSELAAEKYKANPAAYAERQLRVDPAHRRDLRLRRQYGITAAQYVEMFEAQGGVCAVCGRPPKNAPLNVDHDHATGLVRGLLCWHCNSRVIGGARDDLELLRKAVAYLENPPAVGVIGQIFGRVGRVTNKRKRKRPTTKKEKS